MVHSLADWFAAHGVWLAPSIHLVSVAQIPLDLILSHRSSALATAVDDSDDDPLAAHAPALRLAVHVAHELALGSRSRWATYLALCPPREAVPIALLWEGDAQRWARGTELAKECDRIGIDKAVLERFYDDVALPLLSSLPSTSSTSPASLSTFLHAYTLVSSRAFQVSSFHSLALVPLADAFNHSDPPHVHLASDAWVCPECGTLGVCAHDDEDEGERERDLALEPLRTEPARDEANTVDMVSERDIEAGDEVFNMYGSAFSNAHLVAAYGFLLEGNEHDVVSFERRGALETLVCLVGATAGPERSIGELERELDELKTAWRTVSNGGPLLDFDHPLIAPPPPPTSSISALQDLYIDADARISSSLWLVVALIARHVASGTFPSARRRDEEPPAAKRARGAAPDVGAGPMDMLQSAVGLAERAGEVWRASEDALEAGAAGSGVPSSVDDEPDNVEQAVERETLRWAGVLVRGLCAARVEEQVEEARGNKASELYERAEEADDPSLRLAIEFLAGERLLIERVVSQWTFI
ncbi:uncharacterized protein RHOBADRAFT_40589 [Rhodotorula graminis WP1]|uniref:Uncharacterized protein n=1 Tax=Rhodotorula graminis (strain WP1) TaxID=578459 RepID=A0A194SBE4_RHOGW|nr:uncharacterized protein RHOBADRAFT_40589 [Rhodotorula graminis WP1]KPV78043.1 hypothetical protein RHOBADRAFT_40589 [Rhodotorula graminis WP1]